MVGGGFPKLVGSGGAGPGALTAGGLGGGPIINAFLEETAPDDPGATLIATGGGAFGLVPAAISAFSVGAKY